MASTLLEAGVLTVGTWIFAELLLRLVEPGMATLEKRALAMQLMVLTVYLPSLVMLLRRPNEGDTAELVRTLGRRLRRWRQDSTAPRDTVPAAPL